MLSITARLGLTSAFGFPTQGGGGRINELTLDQWRKIQAVNYDSVFYAMKAVGPIFEAQGSGSFIATTSISAHIVNVPLDQVSRPLRLRTSAQGLIADFNSYRPPTTRPRPVSCTCASRSPATGACLPVSTRSRPGEHAIRTWTSS